MGAEQVPGNWEPLLHKSPMTVCDNIPDEFASQVIEWQAAEWVASHSWSAAGDIMSPWVHQFYSNTCLLRTTSLCRWLMGV